MIRDAIDEFMKDPLFSDIFFVVDDLRDGWLRTRSHFMDALESPEAPKWVRDMSFTVNPGNRSIQMDDDHHGRIHVIDKEQIEMLAGKKSRSLNRGWLMLVVDTEEEPRVLQDLLANMRSSPRFRSFIHTPSY